MDTEIAATELERAIEAGDEEAGLATAQVLLNLGAQPTYVTSALSRAMARLGQRFQTLDIFVPDLLIAADAFEAAMQVVEPALLESEASRKLKGTVVVGVVEGDIHTLGKNLVAVMLRANGFQVHDLGRDVKVARFAKAAQEFQADIIAMSSLMTTTMGRMKDVIDLLVTEGVRDDHRVIVGGAPVAQQFADEIGADGYAEDAPGAVVLANRLLTSDRPGGGEI